MEAQRAPNKRNPRKTTPRHIIKMAKIKDKERALKAARERKRLLIKEIQSGYQQKLYRPKGVA